VINKCIVGSLLTYVYLSLWKLSRTETFHLTETACVHGRTLIELYVRSKMIKGIQRVTLKEGRFLICLELFDLSEKNQSIEDNIKSRTNINK
jgi:hypothetical protein